MGAAYCAEEDDEGGGVVPLPKSSLFLKDWTTGELSRIWTDGQSNWDDLEQCELLKKSDLKMFSIPLIINTHNRPLHLLSKSQMFLSGVLRGVQPPSPLPPSSPPMESHHGIGL